MKKYLKIATVVSIMVFAISLINNTSANAQTPTDDEDSPKTLVPPTNPASIREKLRADIENKAQNARINQETRNTLTERRLMGTTTPPFMNGSTTPRMRASTTPMMNPLRDGDDRRPASSTPMMRRDGQENEQNALRQRKENVAKQFEVAVNNLKDLRKRISSRIDKEVQNGRDMTQAKQLLVVADTKLAQLKTSMETLKASSIASTTNPVNLDSMRKLVSDTQKSIKDAQKSLNDVVVAIAHAMGLKNGTASSTRAQ